MIATIVEVTATHLECEMARLASVNEEMLAWTNTQLDTVTKHREVLTKWPVEQRCVLVNERHPFDHRSTSVHDDYRDEAEVMIMTSKLWPDDTLRHLVSSMP